MRKAALALALAAAVAGCNRQSSYQTPRAGTPEGGPAEDTWVAQPTDLTEQQVLVVQRALASRGFEVDASGTFDPATQTALADFQRSRGLPATGNLNADTAAALGIDPGEVRPAPADQARAAGGSDGRTDAATPAARPGQEPGATSTSPSTATGAGAVDR